MVTLAKTVTPWDRAAYLEVDQPRQPQAIGELMEQLLSRYAQGGKAQVIVAAEDGQPVHSRSSNQLLGSTL
jgi:hypothetical protein